MSEPTMQEARTILAHWDDGVCIQWYDESLTLADARDRFAAAVRRDTLAEVVKMVESEACAESLAHAVDDINPRSSHTADQADARIYCRHIAGFLRAALTTMEDQ